MVPVPTTPLEPPRPPITPTAQPFWTALAEHRVVLQRCGACSSWIHYPRVRCPKCGSGDLTFNGVSGTGVIYAFTIARQATAPHFERQVPQVIAIVQLDVGIRLTTTLVVEDLDAINVGDPVEPYFDDGKDGITLLRYRCVG